MLAEFVKEACSYSFEMMIESFGKIKQKVNRSHVVVFLGVGLVLKWLMRFSWL